MPTFTVTIDETCRYRVEVEAATEEEAEAAAEDVITNCDDEVPFLVGVIERDASAEEIIKPTESEPAAADPAPEETLVQFCDRLLGLGDQFLEDLELSPNQEGERALAAERKPEWERARKLMLDAVGILEALSEALPVTDDELDAQSSEKDGQDAWSLNRLLRQVQGWKNDDAILAAESPEPNTARDMATRAALLKERNALLREHGDQCFGTASLACRRVEEIDRELMLCESDIEFLNKNPDRTDPDDIF